ncbi:hypothetical protein BROC_01448 [Candidatus Brocadiaceae bacterium]|nr:hypothetical protein BROC_01448 [Candidatus Brocadiaceae bacterium]
MNIFKKRLTIYSSGRRKTPPLNLEVCAMRIKILLSLFLSFALVFPVFLQDTSSSELVKSIPFTTVEQGEISYYRYNDSSFIEADMLMRDRDTWREFWTVHTEGLQPAPVLPDVNFGKEMVIVSLLGLQSTGGGPSINVLEVNIDHDRRLHALIEDNENPGMLTILTNPFHIIKLKKLPVRSVVFEHRKP